MVKKKKNKLTIADIAEVVTREDLLELLQTRTTTRIAKELGICRNSLYKLRILHEIPIIKREPY